MILSDVPDTPLIGPSSDASVTNEYRIKADFGPQSASANGGSPILSYELQVDYGIGVAGFESLIGGDPSKPSLETTFLVETNVASGAIYRFRYRSLNANGWPDFSPITYIKAAARPVRPTASVFLDATADYITKGDSSGQ